MHSKNIDFLIKNKYIISMLTLSSIYRQKGEKLMKEKINWKSVVAGLILLLVGIGGILLDIFWLKTATHVWISIGCSLIASGLVILLTSLFVERRQESPLDVWGIKNIYPSRSRMNEDCDVSLRKAKYQVDIIAFGLTSFRTEQEKLTKKLLRNGVSFRIITMNPESPFVAQREKEENSADGQIKNTINSLIAWAEKLNGDNSHKGKIEIKGYSCMTLDFYWRVDDDIYVGPYWLGYLSQQTISYKFTGKTDQGFTMYSNYFDKIWNNSEILTTLVTASKPGKRK